MKSWCKTLIFNVAAVETYCKNLLDLRFHWYGSPTSDVARTIFIFKQESPSAWTQKAYRPPCSEYSSCCPNWVPPHSPTPVMTWPGGTQVWYPPAGYPPILTWPGGYHTWVPPSRVPPRQGTPPAGPSRVPTPQQGTTPTPQLDLAGYPPGVCPMAFWEMLQSIMGYGYPPPGVDKLTKWNYHLPVVLRTRPVIKWLNLLLWCMAH